MAQGRRNLKRVLERLKNKENSLKLQIEYGVCARKMKIAMNKNVLPLESMGLVLQSHMRKMQ
jgi:hypothetical protein